MIKKIKKKIIISRIIWSLKFNYLKSHIIDFGSIHNIVLCD